MSAKMVLTWTAPRMPSSSARWNCSPRLRKLRLRQRRWSNRRSPRRVSSLLRNQNLNRKRGAKKKTPSPPSSKLLRHNRPRERRKCPRRRSNPEPVVAAGEARVAEAGAGETSNSLRRRLKPVILKHPNRQRRPRNHPPTSKKAADGAEGARAAGEDAAGMCPLGRRRRRPIAQKPPLRPVPG